MGLVSLDNIDDVFTYHPPKGDFQLEKYHQLRQEAKNATRVVLENPDPKSRIEAIARFARIIERSTGECRDQGEAMGCLQAGIAFVKGAEQLAVGRQPRPINRVQAALEGRLPEADPTCVYEADEAAQAIIGCIRAALMWANVSIALEGRI